MKRTRILVASALGAAALVAAAAPAMADTPVPVTSLPAEVVLPAGGTISVNVPNARVCAAGTANLKVFVVGNQDAVVPLTVPGAGCSAGQLNYTIVDNPNSLRINATVKFTADRGEPGKGKVVQTLVVHVEGNQQALGQQDRICHDHGRKVCVVE